MSELPCCPFCGGSQFGVGYDGQPAHTLYVVCESCGATGPRSKSRTGSGVACDPAGVEAIDGWKQRVITKEQVTKMASVVSDREELHKGWSIEQTIINMLTAIGTEVRDA